MIPGVCPECGRIGALTDYLEDAAAREALAALARLVPAPLGKLVVEYLGLHAPAGKRVQMRKLARVINDLADLISAGTVTRGRETLPAPLAAWQRGLEEVLANRDSGSLSLPLAGHGYLCEIVHRQQRGAGAKDRRASAPLHPSHRPFDGAVGAGLPALDPGASAGKPAPTKPSRPDKGTLISRRSSLQKLLEHATGVAAQALRAQIAAIDKDLRALGVQLPPPEGPSDG